MNKVYVTLKTLTPERFIKVATKLLLVTIHFFPSSPDLREKDVKDKQVGLKVLHHNKSLQIYDTAKFKFFKGETELWS